MKLCLTQGSKNDRVLLLKNEYVDEVHMVGIYVIGGIGKETLAKGIYD